MVFELPPPAALSSAGAVGVAEGEADTGLALDSAVAEGVSPPSGIGFTKVPTGSTAVALAKPHSNMALASE